MTKNTDKAKAQGKPELPERAFAEHPWPTSDKSGAIAVWRSAYTKALGERENYKAHAEKLAEALRGMMVAFAWKANETPESELQSDVRRAIQALAAYESEAQR